MNKAADINFQSSKLRINFLALSQNLKAVSRKVTSMLHIKFLSHVINITLMNFIRCDCVSN